MASKVSLVLFWLEVHYLTTAVTTEVCDPVGAILFYAALFLALLSLGQAIVGHLLKFIQLVAYFQDI